MKRKIVSWTILGVMVIWAYNAYPDEAWRDLNNQVLRLYQAGDRKEVIPLAEKTLNKAESQFGQDSPETALSLNNLAMIYKSNGRYPEAAKLYERSIAIGEKIAGPNSDDLLVLLNNLAACYEAMGQKEKARKIYDRIRAMGHPQTADVIKKRAEKNQPK